MSVFWILPASAADCRAKAKEEEEEEEGEEEEEDEKEEEEDGGCFAQQMLISNFLKLTPACHASRTPAPSNQMCRQMCS